MSRTQSLLFAAMLMSSGTAFAADTILPQVRSLAQVPAPLRLERIPVWRVELVETLGQVCRVALRQLIPP